MINIKYADPAPSRIEFEVDTITFSIEAITTSSPASGTLYFEDDSGHGRQIECFYSRELREIAENLIAAADAMDA